METLRVLVVEDAADDALLITLELRRSGLPIHFERVDEPVAMRAALEREPWHLVTIDWSMPKFSGLGALGLLKEMALDVPFIIVSGAISEESAVEAMRAGAHDCVLKGRLTRLVPVVERELRESEARRERRRSEAALRAAEARYRRIVETTSEGVWVLDAGSKTTFANARMAAMLGHGVGELEGRSVFDFVDEAALPVLDRAMAGLCAGVA